MSKNKNILFFLCFLVLPLSSCGAEIVSTNRISETGNMPTEITEMENHQEETESGNRLQIIDGCIQPIESFEYKIIPDDSKPIPGKTELVEPFSPWEIKAVIDTKALPNGLSWLRSKVLGVKSANGNSEIWIENDYFDLNSSDAFHQTISIYTPATDQWKFVDIDFGLDIEDYAYISRLYFDNEGSTWGVITTRSIIEGNKSISILSKYNPEENRFEFEPDARVVQKYSNPPNYLDIYVFFDSNNNFWFVVPGDSIYLYEPSENKVTNEISISSIDIYSASMAPDDSIYFVTYNPENPENPELRLYKFTDNNHQLIEIPTPEEIYFASKYGNILVDAGGNLWLDSLAVMEPDGEWYNIIQPAIFITNFAEGMVPRWRRPEIQTETSDGRLWFVGDNGSTWLDRKQQKWCWYSTYQVVPYEDELGNLWIIANDHLFSSNIDY